MRTEYDFTVVLRGYKISAVDAFMQHLEEALGSADPALRASFRDELSRIAFPVCFRGYDRGQVDHYLRLVAHRLG